MGEGVQAGEGVADLADVVEEEVDLLLLGEDRPHRPQVAVEHAEVVVVLELEDPVARAKDAAAASGFRNALAARVQPLLKQLVQRAHPGHAAMHRHQRLDLAGSEAIA